MQNQNEVAWPRHLVSSAIAEIDGMQPSLRMSLGLFARSAAVQ